VQPGQIYNVVVGAGTGPQGTYPACPGSATTSGPAAGSSSISGNGFSNCVANGGLSGGAGGGAGGSGGLGDLVFDGQDGMDFFLGTPQVAPGGASPRGGHGGNPTGGHVAPSAYAGKAPGGGGSSIYIQSTPFTVAGPGANGAVHIRW